MKIGILSAAHVHADSYVGCFRSLPGVELLGLADEDEARGAEFAKRYGLEFFGSYGKLLDAGPDAVVVTSENAGHRRPAEMAAARGVHILCEKPLATTAEDARAIVEAARAAGVVLMTAFPMRFSVSVKMVRDQLAAGALGAPLCFNGSNQGQLPPKDRAWFTDPVLAGGGAVTDHLVHLADILRWYLGREAVEVYAVANRIFHADEAAVETGAIVSIRFDGGVFATIDCSWSRPENWPSWGGLSFDMITDRGGVRVDPFRQNLTVFGAKSPESAGADGAGSREAGRDWAAASGHGGSAGAPKWHFWGSDADQAMIAEFVSAVREGRAPAVTGEDGLAAVEIVEAAYQSIREGRPVVPGSINAAGAASAPR